MHNDVHTHVTDFALLVELPGRDGFNGRR